MDTRTALLDSAESVCRKKGYDGFSYADLAAAVGIRKASIHHHFPTKSDLVQAMLDRYSENFFVSLSTIKDKNATAADKIRSYLAVYDSALQRGQSLCLCVALSAGRDSLSAETLKKLNQFHSQNVAWLTEIYTQGQQDKSIIRLGTPLDEATATLALVEGAQLIARAAQKISLFEKATHLLSTRLK